MAAVTTNIASANVSGQKLKILALATYNQATALLGQIASLQTSLNASTSNAGIPDANDVTVNVEAIISDLTILNIRMSKMVTDLTIPV